MQRLTSRVLNSIKNYIGSLKRNRTPTSRVGVGGGGGDGGDDGDGGDGDDDQGDWETVCSDDDDDDDDDFEPEDACYLTIEIEYLA